MNSILQSISQIFIEDDNDDNDNNDNHDVHNNQSNKNLIEYIEKIQTKFTNQIDELNLENEKLKKKLELSEKEANEYYSKYIETKECLDIHVQANNNLTESINKSRQNKEPNFLSMFNDYFK